MTIRTGNPVARRAELGTVVAITSVGDKPATYEGAWPQHGGRMAVVAWPGRKKLTIEPLDNLTTFGED
jgi:hypothetical protein